MSYRTSTRFAGLAAAMLASLVIVSVANARPMGLAPDRADKIGVITPSTITVPDRADKIGVITAGPVGAPDRADQLGTAKGPGPVSVVAAPSSSSDSFAWSDTPVLAAAAIFAVVLLVTVGSLVARKRTDSAALAS
jgi:hypothetical protein